MNDIVLRRQESTIFSKIMDTLVLLLVVDGLIVLFALLAISAGESVAHIPFWDAQIKFVINLIS